MAKKGTELDGQILSAKVTDAAAQAEWSKAHKEAEELHRQMREARQKEDQLRQRWVETHKVVEDLTEARKDVETKVKKAEKARKDLIKRAQDTFAALMEDK